MYIVLHIIEICIHVICLTTFYRQHSPNWRMAAGELLTAPSITFKPTRDLIDTLSIKQTMANIEKSVALKMEPSLVRYTSD